MAFTRINDPLTAAQLRAMLDYDPLTGVFTWKHRPECPPFWNARWAGKSAGVTDHGYRYVTINQSLQIRSQSPRVAICVWPMARERDRSREW